MYDNPLWKYMGFEKSPKEKAKDIARGTKNLFFNVAWRISKKDLEENWNRLRIPLQDLIAPINMRERWIKIRNARLESKLKKYELENAIVEILGAIELSAKNEEDVELSEIYKRYEELSANLKPLSRILHKLDKMLKKAKVKEALATVIKNKFAHMLFDRAETALMIKENKVYKMSKFVDRYKELIKEGEEDPFWISSEEKARELAREMEWKIPKGLEKLKSLRAYSFERDKEEEIEKEYEEAKKKLMNFLEEMRKRKDGGVLFGKVAWEIYLNGINIRSVKSEEEYVMDLKAYGKALLKATKAALGTMKYLYKRYGKKYYKDINAFYRMVGTFDIFKGIKERGCYYIEEKEISKYKQLKKAVERRSYIRIPLTPSKAKLYGNIFMEYMPLAHLINGMKDKNSLDPVDVVEQLIEYGKYADVGRIYHNDEEMTWSEPYWKITSSAPTLPPFKTVGEKGIRSIDEYKRKLWSTLMAAEVLRYIW